MKKLLLPLLSILLFTACQKEVTTPKAKEEIAGATANKETKINVCHYDPITGNSKTIEVTQNALAGHLAHGDLQGDCSAVLTNICNQDWMTRNLDVTTYRNGDIIPEVTDPTGWIGLTTGAWCYYSNNSTNGTTYGKLYNWYAINDPRGLAPIGWHIPTNDEFTTLSACLGGDVAAGGKMKSEGTIEAGTGLWKAPNTDATNSTGFTALPGGSRSYFFGTDFNIGVSGFWWSSSERDFGNAWYRAMFYNLSGFARGSGIKQTGYSVRCVRD